MHLQKYNKAYVIKNSTESAIIMSFINVIYFSYAFFNNTLFKSYNIVIFIVMALCYYSTFQDINFNLYNVNLNTAIELLNNYFDSKNFKYKFLDNKFVIYVDYKVINIILTKHLFCINIFIDDNNFETDMFLNIIEYIKANLNSNYTTLDSNNQYLKEKR